MHFLPPAGTSDGLEAVPVMKLGGSLGTALISSLGGLEFAKIPVNFRIDT